MKQIHHLLLAALSCAPFVVAAKRPTLAGLADESNSIFTFREKNNWITGAAATGAAVAGLANYEGTFAARMVYATIGALAGGAVVYCAADTAGDVFKRALAQLRAEAGLIINLNNYPDMIIYQVRLHYVQSDYPLVSALHHIQKLVADFNLFVDTMNNSRITNEMSSQAYEGCAELVPVFENALEILCNAMVAIKADAGFHEEHERYTAYMHARAARDAAIAQAHSANAQWMHAWNCAHPRR